MNNYLTDKFRRFCGRKGIDFDTLTPAQKSTLFEHFAAYVLLRRWHLEDLDPTETDSIIIGGHFDHQLDAAAVVMGDQLITTAEQFEQVASQPEETVVNLIFVQSTMTERFDLQKMQVFVNGAQMFLENEDFFQANEGLRRQRELSAAIIEQYPGEEKQHIHVFLYFVALPEAEKKHLISQWRRWSENQIRKGGFQNVTVEGINEGRFMRCLDRIDVSKGLRSTQPSDEYERSLRISTLMEVPTQKEGVAGSLIGCIPAKDFLSLLEREDGQGLLDTVFTENVRGFKGLNAAVNRAIGETITNAEERSQFFLRNNGITIVADAVSYTGAVLTLKNYQIVNGLQTSHVLYHHRSSFEEDLHDILIPVKIAVTEDPAIKDGIIEGTNRQSKVGDVEFLSRRPIVRRIEAFFDEKRETGEAPCLWLERRPGQFSLHPDVPPVSRISPRDLMQAYAAVYLDYPHESKSGPAKVIKRVPSQIFAEDHLPESYHIAGWLLHLVRAFCLSRQIDKRTIDWHLAFGLRYCLHPDAFPVRGDAILVTEFNMRLRDRIRNSGKIEEYLDRVQRIVQEAGDGNGGRRGGRRTDFLALSRTTAQIRRRIVEGC